MLTCCFSLYLSEIEAEKGFVECWVLLLKGHFPYTSLSKFLIWCSPYFKFFFCDEILQILHFSVYSLNYLLLLLTVIFFFFAFLKRFPSQRKTGSLLSCDIEWKVAKLQKQKTMATDLQPNNLQMWIFSVFRISPYWIVQWFCKQLHFDRRHIMFQSCCHRI